MALRIKEILKEKGQTQKDLAQRMGVAEISLSRSINGNPNLDTLQKIADALEVEISELFTPKETDTITCPRCGSKFQLIK
jgi:transcriptional regulator with XRE-family HTH domain